ncbi:MAG: L,D-transpeptidase [Chloroflexi bacterium]|nr:L,D-transpeptidase [Chloroflexota bacterium]
MSKETVPPRRKFLYPVLIILLICAVVAVAAWTATSSPALGFNVTATPTHSNPFALVELIKPTYTATSTPTPTAIPTNTPEPTAIAEIIGGDTYQNPDQSPAQTYTGNKYILVDISEQHMYVYEGDTVVYSWVSSTGMNNATRVGLFSVLDKIPSAYGATWNIWMPNWLGIYYSGHLENGIHALPILSNGATLWEGYLGVPISYGCVVLGTYESQVLYDWAEIGVPVEIQR